MVGVCWYEARAYCAWLSSQTDRVFSLPSEAQWEIAARGRDGRRYAWGNAFDPTRCNAFDAHVRRPTPIGVFPAGNTPEGVADMNGNVWEWTSSAYQKFPYDALDGREDAARDATGRVGRGGSWRNRSASVRSTYRNDFVPAFRNFVVGFRLVRL